VSFEGYPPGFADWSQDRRNAYFAKEAKEYDERKRVETPKANGAGHPSKRRSNGAPPIGAPIEPEEPAEFKTAAAFCAEYEPICYVVEPFIRSSSLYTLTAKTGVGKTALFIIMALAVATGRGELLGRAVTKGRVAYIVAENPDGFRMRLMVAAFILNINLGEIADDLVILDKRAKPEQIGSRLKILAAVHPFSLIIGDTFQALFDGDDLNNNAQTGEFTRRWRTLTQINGSPAVVIAAHPVKNATGDSMTPYGGGATLNEVDGNLTLNAELGGVIELHWQGKLRGVEFEPVKFRLEALTSPDVNDVKGREVQLPVLRPINEADAEHRGELAVSRDLAILRAIRDDPTGSLSTWSRKSGVPKPTVDRRLKQLTLPKQGKLVEKTLGKWSLTRTGQDAIEAATGAPFRRRTL
jgi:hypothetical protein